MSAERGKTRILISACLLDRGLIEAAERQLPEGELPVSSRSWPYRYDGNSKAITDSRIIRWAEEGKLIPICPEVMGGLSVPREPSEISRGRVLNRLGADVTAEYDRGAEEALRIAREAVEAGCGVIAVLKQGSPSCGSRAIHDGTFTGKKIPGRGITAEMLIRAGFAVFDETELDQAEAAAEAGPK